MSLEKLENTLAKYAKENYNVLLTGKHGIGKTAIIKSIFGELYGEMGRDWLYFSASTLDPWVDFIGIPKAYTKPDGSEVFRIIPPEHLAEENCVQAIFFDEINRAEEKTLNAIMELIQFKSINGRKFRELKCVWAAENPADDADEEYAVRPLDPAQRDRFQVQIAVPQMLNGKYFKSKFTEETYEVAAAWWGPNKDKISPRKLEDLLNAHIKGYDMSDFTSVSVAELSNNLATIGEYKEWVSFSNNASGDEIKKNFTLDRLRSFEKHIKADRKKTLLKNIYTHLPGEAKEYVTKVHKYSQRVNLATAPLGTKARDFIEDCKKNNFGTTTNVIDDFSDFARMIQKFYAAFDMNAHEGFENHFDEKIDAGAIYRAIHFTRSDRTSTNEIRNLIADIQSRSLEKEFRNWYYTMMFVCSKEALASTDTAVINHNTFRLLVKFAGNKEMIKFLGLNKIFFNSWKKCPSAYANDLATLKKRARSTP